MNQCFILLKTSSYICMLVLYMLYQNMFLLCHSIFGISGKQQHGSVKIIWDSHRDGGRAGGATCQWAIISGVLVGRIWVEVYWFSLTSFSKWPPGGHIGFFSFWTLYAAWFLEFALDFQFQISCACYLWLWAEAYWVAAMSLSKWAPGSHIGFFGFWTVTWV